MAANLGCDHDRGGRQTHRTALASLRDEFARIAMMDEIIALVSRNAWRRELVMPGVRAIRDAQPPRSNRNWLIAGRGSSFATSQRSGQWRGSARSTPPRPAGLHAVGDQPAGRRAVGARLAIRPGGPKPGRVT